METRNPPHVFRLLWVAFFCLVVLGVTFGGLKYYEYEKKRVILEKYSEIKAIAELKAGQIHHWRRERYAGALRLTHGVYFSRIVAEWLNDPENERLTTALRTRFKTERGEDYYTDVLLVDPQGRILLAADDHPHPLSGESLVTLNEAMKRLKPVLSSFYLDPADGTIHLDAFAPLVNDGRVLGAVILETHAKDYIYPLIEFWPTPSPTAETLLVRREGDDVLFLNRLRDQAPPSLTFHRPLTQTDLPAVQAVQGRVGMFLGKDYRGRDVLADLRPVPDSPWFMVTKVDMDEIQEEIRYRTRVIALFVGLFVLLTGAGFALVYRKRRDVERRRSEESLQALARRQEAILAAVPNIIMEVDSNRKYTWANPAGLDFFGPDVIGREAAFYFEGEQETYQTVQPLFNGDDSIIYVESWQRRRDGAKRLLAWWCRVLKDDQGQVTGALSSAQDITPQKQAENDLRESEEKFRSLVETLNVGICMTSLDGRVLYANDVVLKMGGYNSPEEFTTVNALDMYADPEDRKRLLAQLGANGSVRNMVTRFRKKDGTLYWISINAVFQYNDAGQPISILGALEDITDRRRMEDQLRQAMKMEAVGTLAGGIAHDFNNLVQVIMGFTQMMQMDRRETDPGGSELAQIYRAAQRARDLVRQLLTFSRKMDGERKPVNLNRVILDTQAMLQRTLPKMIGIELNLTEPPAIVLADAVQMEQILLNLGANAGDAMPEGGRLFIETSFVTLDEEYLKTHVDVAGGEYVRWTVADTGQGMDSETVRHIFDPFFTTKEVGKGTGLGLASVYGIVKSHGGHILCYSETGQGTTFNTNYTSMIEYSTN